MAALWLFGLSGLVMALALGGADPPRAGALLWDEVSALQWSATPGVTVETRAGQVWLTFTQAEQQAVGLGPTVNTRDFTWEVEAAQVAGADAAQVGAVWGWQSDKHQAILINRNGYATVYQQNGARRKARFEWQAWPHIVFDINRVRLDARGAATTVRVNDEVVTQFEARAAGAVGALIISAGPGQVTVRRARLWQGP
jgi:hypothetical protein